MSKDVDVIIVGGGIAGLTAGAFLVRKGLKTLLCEKSAETGGLVKTFWHKGFAFDAGIRAFENSGIVLPMLKNLGLTLDFIDNPVSIGIGSQWVQLKERGNLPAYFELLAKLFPESQAELPLIQARVDDVITYMDVLYGIDNPLFMEKPDKSYLLKTLLPWLLRYQINMKKASRLSEPVRTYLQRLTDNEQLLDMLLQHFFQDTPTFFALSYFGQYFDYTYPRGGTGALPELLRQYFLEQGGTLRTRTAVTSVDAKNKLLQTDQGDSIHYKKLIWAADQKQLYNALGDMPSAAIQRQAEAAQNGRGGDSVLAVFLGIDLDSDHFRERMGAHAFYTPSTQGLTSLPSWQTAKSGGQAALLAWAGLYMERTTYEVSCPSLRDNALAPEGKTSLTVSTLIDINFVRHCQSIGAYSDLKQLCTDKIIAILNVVVPGLAKKIEVALCATPLTLERETGNADGAITGWSFKSQPCPAENRFQKIARAVDTPIPNVFQCGQWTFSPSGLPISILTGKLAADAVIKALSMEARS